MLIEAITMFAAALFGKIYAAVPLLRKDKQLPDEAVSMLAAAPVCVENAAAVAACRAAGLWKYLIFSMPAAVWNLPIHM